MTNSTKILLGILLLVLLSAGYIFLGGEEDTSTPGLTSSAPSGVEEETAAGKKFLSILLRLKELHIDRKIFDDPAFASLQDYGVILTPETPGRSNPFAPLGQLSVLTSIPGLATSSASRASAGGTLPASPSVSRSAEQSAALRGSSVVPPGTTGAGAGVSSGAGGTSLVTPTQAGTGTSARAASSSRSTGTRTLAP